MITLAVRPTQYQLLISPCMSRKRQLELSDIQDETDIYDRLVLKQRKSKKKLLQPDKSSVLLSDKVRLIDEKRNRLKRRNDLPVADDDVNGKHTPLEDEMPVIVESYLLQQERNIQSIPNVLRLCKDMIDHYDELALGLIFPEIEQNHMFRLFLSAASFGLLHLLLFPQEALNLYVSVLRGIITKQNAETVIKTQFSKESQMEKLEPAPPVSIRSSSSLLRTIIRTTELFKVPKRITQLLDEANVQ